MPTQPRSSMNRKFSLLGPSLALAGLFFFTLAGVKCKDDCENIVCAPCPTSRFLVNYVDNLGNCDPAFYANAKVIGLNSTTGDTIYSYGLSSDSCVAAFLIQENVTYHLVSWTPAFRDTISILDWEFQPGVEATECCLCYPVEHADIMIGGDSTHVEWPDSSYENVPITRTIN